ncbi:MAG: sugar phosphate isomerase/epimerase [Candidatus Hydrogenedentes bacterium]|nr:sugar phosphate isomerase/epimerase [Candidatus Hydrogenedentota bacterium]
MQHHKTEVSRRSFIGGAAALAASTLIPKRAFAAESGKPNSDFGGVRIGVITYSFRSMPCSAEDILGYLVKCGLSSVELMGDAAEGYAKKHTPATGVDGPMDGYEALGKLYKDAGVAIHIVKFGDIGDEKMSDKQIDYYFRAAKAAGAKGITRELSEDAAKRLGPMADKHEIMIAFHNHTKIKPDTYDGGILSFGKFLGINLDIGHYLAGTNESPIPLIEKHHDRILSLHLKDRKKNNGANLPWGQGETPLKETLQLIRKNKYPIHGDIELEYEVPAGSDAVKEVTNCVQFCKAALA